MRPAHPGPFSLFPPRARGIQLPPPYLLKLKVRDIPDQKYIQLYSHTPYLAVAKLIFVVFFWASPPFPGWETVLIFPETREVSLGPQPHPASPLSALVNLVWTPSGR